MRYGHLDGNIDNLSDMGLLLATLAGILLAGSAAYFGKKMNSRIANTRFTMNDAGFQQAGIQVRYDNRTISLYRRDTRSVSACRRLYREGKKLFLVLENSKGREDVIRMQGITHGPYMDAFEARLREAITRAGGSLV